jgi:hypothetical protein
MPTIVCFILSREGGGVLLYFRHMANRLFKRQDAYVGKKERTKHALLFYVNQTSFRLEWLDSIYLATVILSLRLRTQISPSMQYAVQGIFFYTG